MRCGPGSEVRTVYITPVTDLAAAPTKLNCNQAEMLLTMSLVVQISDTVYPMYKAYIEPDLKTAHLKIYNTFNPFSGFMDPTYILKSAKRVSKEVISSLLKVCLA